VIIRVTYEVTFSPYERQPARLGMDYHAHVTSPWMVGSIEGPSIAELAHETSPSRSETATRGETVTAALDHACLLLLHALRCNHVIK